MLTLKLYFYLILPSLLFAHPKNHETVAGEVHVVEKGEALEIVQNSKRAVVNWDSFSIGKNETARFIQPSSHAAILNRVVGFETSQILGLLQANGRVYLVNPNGIVIGKEGRIDASCFIGSAMEIPIESFLEGNQLLVEGGGMGKITNLGTIQTRGGSVSLLACRVENLGSIEAPNSVVSLAAGEEILLSPSGNMELLIRPDSKSLGVENGGLIKALEVELQTQGISSLIINKGAVIEANSVVEKEGRIFLCAQEGPIEIQREALLNTSKGNISIESKGAVLNLGTLNASDGGSIEISSKNLYQDGSILANNRGSVVLNVENNYIETTYGLISATEGGFIDIESGKNLYTSGTYLGAGKNGGEIGLFSENIQLCDAYLDASGEISGGVIRVGGSFQGKDPIYFNAKTTSVSGTTQIFAEGTIQGGTIIIWSDQKTDQYGEIRAGKTGFVEISSKGELHQGGPPVQAGVVLFDPQTVTINSTTGIYPQFILNPSPDTEASFGTWVAALTDGNVVVADPTNSTVASSAGAAYLFNGTTGALISAFYGAVANDRVGIGQTGIPGVYALTGNNNFVVTSYFAAIGGDDRGAATWGDGASGVSGMVSTSNSLCGASDFDSVGDAGIIALTNGNYVVCSSVASLGVSESGAATWCDGSTGRTGVIAIGNSLYGGTSNDNIGQSGVALSNGNYVVLSPTAVVTGGGLNRGFATWGNGTSGTTGVVTTGNSLYGAANNDRVGSAGAIALTQANGNYVVLSPLANMGGTDRGAATWATGTAATSGAVSTLNSLYGASDDDAVGSDGIALTNGNYVILSPAASFSGVTTREGAATLVDGSDGIPIAEVSAAVAVSATNSFHGTDPGDEVGGDVFSTGGGALALPSGNYVVLSPSAIMGMGCGNAPGGATLINGSTGVPIAGGSIASTILPANSLYGLTGNDNVGRSGIVLSNGNYVIFAPSAFITVANQGAATWVDGTTGRPIGAGSPGVQISTSNSLRGAAASEQVGNGSGLALSDGNYVVISYLADMGGSSRGAITWGNGTTGTTGQVTTSNSLYGTTNNDQVGSGPDVEHTNWAVALADGVYAVASPKWHSGATEVGAVVFGRTNSGGTGGSVGAVSTANSVTGATATSTPSLYEPIENTSNDTVICPFVFDNGGVVRIGLSSVNQITTTLATGQTITILPSHITEMLEDGTSVAIQSAGDINIESAISVGAAAPTSTSLSLTAGNDIVITAGVNSNKAGLNLTATNDITIGNNTVQSTDGNILLIAGVDIVGSASTAIQTTGGSSTLTLVVDNANPSSPNVGSGIVNLPSTSTLSTGGGNLRIYAAKEAVNTFPSTINGTAYSSGTNEAFSTYYPSGSGGSPFKIFYKTAGPPAPTPVISPQTQETIQVSVTASFTTPATAASSSQITQDDVSSDTLPGAPPVQASSVPDPKASCRVPGVSVSSGL